MQAAVKEGKVGASSEEEPLPPARISRYAEEMDDNGDAKEEEDFSRRQKQHLTATADLVKKLEKEMSALPRVNPPEET
jgi:hypothetical protein